MFQAKVSMTNRHMRTRACEHMGISSLTGANVKTTSIVHDLRLIDGRFAPILLIHSDIPHQTFLNPLLEIM